jgi:2-keto-4-pentenoate hydratase/2-oxohepta-3-ene-1,7-dioic acid hydratase in catechol pathway
MRFIRFMKHDGRATWGVAEKATAWEISKKPWLGDWEKVGASFSTEDINLLVPCEPEKIVGVAQNYKSNDDNGTYQSNPIFFLKSPGTLSHSREGLSLPRVTNIAWGEAELAFVVGVDHSSALGFSIFGYLVANDVTRENIAEHDHHLAYSKSARGFCPVGEVIDTSFKPSTQYIRAFQNGRLLREGRLNDRIMDDQSILEELAEWMPLSAGDIILTGTPPRVRERQYLRSGDTFECVIDGLETLKVYIK